ncbi:MAG: PIN domain-containing protein [Polyangiaceae bacterium]
MEFVDTNVLLYAVSTHPSEKSKAERARALLERDDLCLSVQVLQEFYVQATRASRADALSHEQAVLLIESFLRYPAQELTLTVMKAALASKERYQISYWDAAIIEAARALGSTVLHTEDLSDGQDYGGVVVKNPFA